MKKLFLSASALLLTILSLHAQHSASCHGNAVDEFAMIASSEKFVKSHDSPLPFTYQGKGEMVTFKTPDGKEAKGFLLRNSRPTKNYILVFQEWWGLNDYIKKQSAKLFADLGNVNVLALDMYDGKVTANADSARELVTSFETERGQSIIKGALNFVGKDAKIGTIGWCFGGSWSLQGAILAENQGVACVVYYGMPEKDINQLKKLQAPVLGIFASQEEYISPQIVREFITNMKTAGEELTVKMYDAEHGFANPSNPHFDKQATTDAWTHTIAFFKKMMK